MKAALYQRLGAAKDVLTIRDIPLPEPAPGEVRVRIATSGVNPSDVKNRSGATGRPLAFQHVIPHSDGAGVIDALGRGVNTRQVGQRVWLYNTQWKRADGTAAEFVALPEALTVPLPDNVSFEAGACLGIPALTAFRAIELARVATGMTLLVHGGAGSVSHYIIQMAKLKGARVLTTVSSELKAAHALEAGADETINYRLEKVEDAVQRLTGGRGVDAVIDLDLNANAESLPGVLKAHGTIVIYGMSGPTAVIPARWMLQSSISVAFFLIYDLLPEDRDRAVEGLSELLRDGLLKHTIGARFPLESIAQAHEAVESGSIIGNVVVDVLDTLK